jgi:NAD(P)H-hydrate epimerase
MVFTQKLVSVAEMIAIEKQADASGFTYARMMDNAGNNLASVIQERFGFLDEDGILGLVGSGNNGGDTLVALTALALDGWKATAYLVRVREAGDPLLEKLVQAGGRIYHSYEDRGFAELDRLLNEHAILLDGVLGTGIKLPLRGEVSRALEHVRLLLGEMETPPLVIAVDCPSGVDCDLGEAAEQTIPADLTVTMAAIKTGLVRFPAAALVGELTLVGIGLPDKLPAWEKINRFVASQEDVRRILPPRPLDAHKGTFGTALILAGSLNYSGAVLLSGRAAYLAGAGLVTLGVPAPLHRALAGNFPEATWLLLPDELGVFARKAAPVVLKHLGRATGILLGPGFGQEETSRGFIEDFLSGEPEGDEKRGLGFVRQPAAAQPAPGNQLPPLVVDADGLKLLAQIQDWQGKLPPQSILTPHPGEMAVLSGVEKGEIQADRLGIAEKFSREWGHVLVLKGAYTVVAAPDGRLVVIPVATPALARAGTGDVLAGLIVGLRAQGVDAFEAAVAGAWIHAQAGLLAAAQAGNTASILAGDLLETIPQVMSELA